MRSSLPHRAARWVRRSVTCCGPENSMEGQPPEDGASAVHGGRAPTLTRTTRACHPRHGSRRSGRKPLTWRCIVWFAAAMVTGTGPCLGQPPSGGSDGETAWNFVVILCDNLGYGDVGCFGSTRYRTPHLDRMAAEGLRLTHCYSASGVCTPSRAALLTGCYPRRVGLDNPQPDGAVLRPVSHNGLHPEEITIAEVLRGVGYTTTCIGKWHLGDQPAFLPTRQGFDSFFGIPYSDDMTPRPGTNWPPLPLMEGERVVEAPVDRNELTRRYTERAIAFMEANRQRPFFLYLPHAMPGSTTAPFSSGRFRGASGEGPYGDAVLELDWSAGAILDAIRRVGIADHTLVVWTSDNGAPRRNPPQGSNAPLKGWGYSIEEGGMRVPAIVWAPGTIAAGQQCAELCTLMDLLPTFAHLAGAELPADRVIDGHNVWSLWCNPHTERSPYDAFYYYHRDRLRAVRSGPWKLYLAEDEPTAGGGSPQEFAYRPTGLFHLVKDVAEQRNELARRPEVVDRLLGYARRAGQDLGDGARVGANVRPVGWVEHPTPRLVKNPAR
ncbi:MAG: arylsulfatase [Planctomycetota bacterium]|nr:MAG: arylsulfatase [Planctomycetota bacterium]